MPIFLAVLLVVGLILLYAFLVEPRRLQVNHLSVSLSGLSQPVRILFISDLHANPSQIISLKRALSKLTPPVKPKLLVIGGDFLHRGRGLEKVEKILSELGSLNLSTIAVLGNHDLMAGQKTEEKLIKALGSQGVSLLQDTDAIFQVPGQNQSIQVIGIDELERNQAYYDRRNFRHPDQFRKIAASMPALSRVEETNLPRLLVAHNPDGIHLTISGAKPELVLSGHTHGGQVLWMSWIPQWFWRFILRYEFYPAGSYQLFAGLRKAQSQTHLVSRGISGHPMRFGRIPEAHLIELLPSTKA